MGSCSQAGTSPRATALRSSSVHGGGDRDGARAHAAMLARAGYGVLLYDARGRGQSQGDPDAYGWTWGRDVDAAITWLEQRLDVQAGRIGALGLSTGADVLTEVGARRHDIRAVVADGTTTRSLTDTAKVLHGGGLLSLPFWWTQYTAAQILENSSPGPSLAMLAAHLHTRILFIASTWNVERSASRVYARVANQPGDLWEVDAGHTQGLHDHPHQYAQHVLNFFAKALLGQRWSIRGRAASEHAVASPWRARYFIGATAGS